MVDVLVVEAHSGVRGLISRILAWEGCRVIEIDGGDEVLPLLRQHRPELAVIDARLPGTTGLELVRAVKADPDLKTTRIILLSTVLGDRDAALAAGAETYLAKPFRVRELRAAVQRVIGSGEIDLAS